MEGSTCSPTSSLHARICVRSVEQLVSLLPEPGCGHLEAPRVAPVLFHVAAVAQPDDLQLTARNGLTSYC
jgi:hypothetical protein